MCSVETINQCSRALRVFVGIMGDMHSYFRSGICGRFNLFTRRSLIDQELLPNEIQMCLMQQLVNRQMAAGHEMRCRII